MSEETSGLEPEAQVGLLLNQMLTEATGQPCMVAHWVAIVDVRQTDGDTQIGTLMPNGMPPWIMEAMIREASGFDGYSVEGDEDEDD